MAPDRCFRVPWAGMLLALAASCLCTPARADVVTDGTLGPALELAGPDYVIPADLGTQAGSNLFHSFARFGIEATESATFTEGSALPGSIDRVLGRVTGGEASWIDGLLRSTIPGADLYLMNPSGIVFGQGAQLDVQGSFHATTADYLGLGEGGAERFYADPLRSSVLSVAPPTAFGFLGGGADATASLSVAGSMLEVPAGETLSLVGRDGVAISGARLAAPSGRIDLAALASPGELRVDGADADDPLDASGFAALGSVAISEASVVEVGGDPPGAVFLRGGEIRIEGSELLAVNQGAGPGGRISLASDDSIAVTDDALVQAGTENSGPGGEIELRAPEVLLDAGRIASTSFAEASGDAGTVHVEAGTLVARNGDRFDFDPETEKFRLPDDLDVPVGLSAETRGAGSGGRVEIVADDVVVTGGAFLGVYTIGPDASRAAGTIQVSAGALEIRDGALVHAGSGFGSQGDAGEIRLDVGTLLIDGALETQPVPAVVTVISYGGLDASGNPLTTEGNAGTITIHAGRVELTNAGDLRGGLHAGTSTQVTGEPGTSTGVIGEPGTIDITAESVEIRGRMEMWAGSWGSIGEDGGTIRIKAESLELREGGALWVLTQRGSTGDAGTIEVTAESVLIEGGRIEAGTWSKDTEGHAGTIQVTAFQSLEIREGGYIAAGSSQESSGNAGSIDVTAGSVEIREGGGILAGSDTGSTGDAGDVSLEVGSLTMRDGAAIDASSYGGGAAGTIDVDATGSVFISHAGGERFELRPIVEGVSVELTGVYSGTVLGGDGGTISIEAPEVTVIEGAIVGVSTIGGGDAGEVMLRGERITVSDGAFVDSTSLPLPDAPDVGDAGAVRLEASEWIAVTGHHPEFGDASRVASATLGPGEAGAVTLVAPRIVVDGGAIATTTVPSTLGAGGDWEGGDGGTIRLEAAELWVIGGGRIETTSLTEGAAGAVVITSSESIAVTGAGSGIASRTGADGAGGDVTLRAPKVEVAEGGELSAESTAGLQEVRDIFASLDAEGLLAEPPEQATANAGSVHLAASKVLVRGGSIATNAPAADGGDIAIEARDQVHLVAGELTASVRDGVGGNITIDPVFVILQDGSRIVANAGEGAGGNIRITTDFLFAFPDSVIDASSQFGVDGTVEIRSPDVILIAGLVPLPAQFLDAAALLAERCAARGARGSFVVGGRAGLPASPTGYLPAHARSAATPAARRRSPAGREERGGGAPVWWIRCGG